MTNFNDLDTYNGGSMHDMWVGFYNSEYTSIPDVFSKVKRHVGYDITDINNFLDNFNDWE